MGRGSGAIRAVLAGLLVAAIPLLLYRGFTVDDALIPARYAHNLAHGRGYVFNAGGAPSDGVTPLGFPYLLAPFAKSGPLAALAFSRTLGALAWLASAALLSLVVLRMKGSRWRFAALSLILCSAPLAAWSQAGLETGLVTAIVGLALFLRARGRAWAGSVVAGVAAAMRPELLPMALVLAFPRGPEREDQDRDRDRAPITFAHFGRSFVGATPFVLVACARLALFGHAAPLSIYAKPPVMELGAAYAGACFLLTGPVAAIAPFVWMRIDAWARWLLVAVAVHFAAVVVVGGDWMPLSRLVVPALPVVVVASAYVAATAEPAFTIGRFILALTAESVTFVRMRESSARVFEERTALIREVAPYLQDRKAMATVDVGWVGAATGATVIDLAGVTDPFVAFLPGSHTAKQIPDSMLDARHVDTLVLYLRPGADLAKPWSESQFDKGVERYVALGPGIDEAFTVAYVTTGRLHYVILYRVESALANSTPTPSGRCGQNLRMSTSGWHPTWNSTPTPSGRRGQNLRMSTSGRHPTWNSPSSP